MIPLIIPQVNPNGTPKQALVEQQVQVLDALDRLEEAMGRATPDERDYRTMADGPLPGLDARAAWAERRMMIAAFRKEIEVHAIAIHEQGTTT